MRHGKRINSLRKTFGGKKKHVGGVADDSPIKALSPEITGILPRQRSPKRVQPEPPAPAPLLPFIMAPPQGKQTKGELRSRAVLKYKVLEAGGLATKEFIDLLAQENDVSIRTLKSWVKRLTDGESLVDKPRSGAPSKREIVLNQLEQQARQFQYCFSYRKMSASLNNLAKEGNLSTTVTPTTVMNILEKEGWKTVRITTRPILTQANQAARLAWCHSRNGLQSTESIWRLHIDEKWFYSFSLDKMLYLPPNVQVPPQKIKSKRYIPKVMFLACVGMPNASFDGSIGLWPVTEAVVAKRNSKNRTAGTVEAKSVTMDKKVFIEMMKKKLLPAIIDKVRHLSAEDRDKLEEIEIQMDNAPGHAPKTSLVNLNQHFQEKMSKHFEGISIKIVCQPPNSPDLNLLDLGAWRSLQTACNEVKDQFLISDTSGSIEGKLISAVLEAWKQWENEEKLRALVETLFLFMEEIIACGGSNHFRQPHSGRKKKRT